MYRHLEGENGSVTKSMLMIWLDDVMLYQETDVSVLADYLLLMGTIWVYSQVKKNENITTPIVCIRDKLARRPCFLESKIHIQVHPFFASFTSSECCCCCCVPCEPASDPTPGVPLASKSAS